MTTKRHQRITNLQSRHDTEQQQRQTNDHKQVVFGLFKLESKHIF